MLLVDTHDHRPDPDRRGDWDWVGAFLSWLFPWPAIIVWLIVGTIAIPGIPGMLFAMVMIVVVGWRGAKALGDGGLNDYHQ